MDCELWASIRLLQEPADPGDGGPSLVSKDAAVKHKAQELENGIPSAWRCFRGAPESRLQRQEVEPKGWEAAGWGVLVYGVMAGAGHLPAWVGGAQVSG